MHYLIWLDVSMVTGRLQAPIQEWPIQITWSLYLELQSNTCLQMYRKSSFVPGCPQCVPTGILQVSPGCPPGVPPDILQVSPGCSPRYPAGVPWVSPRVSCRCPPSVPLVSPALSWGHHRAMAAPLLQAVERGRRTCVGHMICHPLAYVHLGPVPHSITILPFLCHTLLLCYTHRFTWISHSIPHSHFYPIPQIPVPPAHWPALPDRLPGTRRSIATGVHTRPAPARTQVHPLCQTTGPVQVNVL